MKAPVVVIAFGQGAPPTRADRLVVVLPRFLFLAALVLALAVEAVEVAALVLGGFVGFSFLAFLALLGFLLALLGLMLALQAFASVAHRLALLVL